VKTEYSQIMMSYLFVMMRRELHTEGGLPAACNLRR
jgi:hypothetical protein